jgi:hypothetical protein
MRGEVQVVGFALDVALARPRHAGGRHGTHVRVPAWPDRDETGAHGGGGTSVAQEGQGVVEWW